MPTKYLLAEIHREAQKLMRIDMEVNQQLTPAEGELLAAVLTSETAIVNFVMPQPHFEETSNGATGHGGTATWATRNAIFLALAKFAVMSEETGQHHLIAYGVIRETHRYLSLEGVQNQPGGTVLPFAVFPVEGGAGEIGIEAEVEHYSWPTATVTVTVTVIASHSGREAGQEKAGEIGSGIVSEPAMQKLNEENVSKDEI
jgi:hypothetical protein